MSSQHHQQQQQDTRPFITCHVLDTTQGKPGANISVTLTLLSPCPSTSPPPTFHGTTNSDGRVAGWASASPEHDLFTLMDDMEPQAKMVWKLAFDVEAYYGEGRTFWDVVELSFSARKCEGHYHVPLLLGPWSYTTYRGS
ncbi:hypothetical protein MBLNU230_g4076t1 [Neophaeotheca triangularis]